MADKRMNEFVPVTDGAYIYGEAANGSQMKIKKSDLLNGTFQIRGTVELYLGATGVESNQVPCLSLVQFQIDEGELVLSAYQRSSDANLGLPSDIYHLYLMSRQIECPLKSITLYLGNVHIYENNISGTRALIAGDETVRFELNV